MDVLNRIKALVLRGRVRFTLKAREEMRADCLEVIDVVQAVLNAQSIEKTLRAHGSTGRSRERLYVIKGFTYRGTPIYTKGKIDREAGEEFFYVFISSKISTLGA